VDGSLRHHRGSLACLNPGFCPYYCPARHSDPFADRLYNNHVGAPGLPPNHHCDCACFRTFGRSVQTQEPLQCRICGLNLGLIALRSVPVPVPRLGPCRLSSYLGSSDRCCFWIAATTLRQIIRTACSGA
jgi:hypothetical protein